MSGCVALTHTDKMSIALTLSIFTPQRKLKDPKISEEWECFTEIQIKGHIMTRTRTHFIFLHFVFISSITIVKLVTKMSKNPVIFSIVNQVIENKKSLTPYYIQYPAI